jgi:Fe-Mn family superoxide dismutase
MNALPDNLPADLAAVAALSEAQLRDFNLASEAFAAPPEGLGEALVLDVRRTPAFAASPVTLPGATWRDPVAVAQWGTEVPKDRDVLVYCVYGHEVGRYTAMRLQAMGVNARFLPGGIDAWQAAGKPVQSKATA